MIHEKIEIQLKNSEFKANLFTYFLDNSLEIDPERKRPVVLICPGGGYVMTSDREAEALAVRFMAMGYHAAILRYSTAPARFPEALLQLATAVAMLRENAEKWHIDTEKIVVQGSSAGGHLAASLGVFWNKPFVAEALGIASEKFRPNGLMLSYPVITSGEKAHQDLLKMFWVKSTQMKRNGNSCLWNTTSRRIHRRHSCGIQHRTIPFR